MGALSCLPYAIALSLYLRTFGGLAVETGAGGGETPQLGPRRLALLAILAAAGARGITREKLLGILWPEKDEEQARHTLSQTLYLLKREAGVTCVTGTAQLRLDVSVASDVAQFGEAIIQGWRERNGVRTLDVRTAAVL